MLGGKTLTSHRNRLIQPRLHIPARAVSRVRKPGMRASDCLLGLLLVDLVACLAAFFRNRQNSRTSERFERIVRFRMNHPHSKPQRVASVREQKQHNKSQKYPLGNRPCGNIHYPPQKTRKPSLAAKVCQWNENFGNPRLTKQDSLSPAVINLSIPSVGPWRSWERASMASRRSWVRIPSAPPI
jgi:hypothetical protein